jgi:hypothetical protein
MAAITISTLDTGKSCSPITGDTFFVDWYKGIPWVLMLLWNYLSQTGLCEIMIDKHIIKGIYARKSVRVYVLSQRCNNKTSL